MPPKKAAAVKKPAASTKTAATAAKPPKAPATAAKGKVKKESAKKSSPKALPEEAPELSDEQIQVLLGSSTADHDGLLQELYAAREADESGNVGASETTLVNLKKLNSDIKIPSTTKKAELLAFTAKRVDTTLGSYSPPPPGEEGEGAGEGEGAEEEGKSVTSRYHQVDDPVDWLSSLAKEEAEKPSGNVLFYVFAKKSEAEVLEEVKRESGLDNVSINRAKPLDDLDEPVAVVFFNYVPTKVEYEAKMEQAPAGSLLLVLHAAPGKKTAKTPSQKYHELAVAVGVEDEIYSPEDLEPLRGLDEDENGGDEGEGPVVAPVKTSTEPPTTQKGVDHAYRRVAKADKATVIAAWAKALGKKAPIVIVVPTSIVRADAKKKGPLAALKDSHASIQWVEHGEVVEQPLPRGIVINYTVPEDYETYEANMGNIEEGVVVTLLGDDEDRATYDSYADENFETEEFKDDHEMLRLLRTASPPVSPKGASPKTSPPKPKGSPVKPPSRQPSPPKPKKEKKSSATKDKPLAQIIADAPVFTTLQLSKLLGHPKVPAGMTHQHLESDLKERYDAEGSFWDAATYTNNQLYALNDDALPKGGTMTRAELNALVLGRVEKTLASVAPPVKAKSPVTKASKSRPPVAELPEALRGADLEFVIGKMAKSGHTITTDEIRAMYVTASA